MKVTSLGWLGTRTAHAEDLAHFYRDVLNLTQVHHEPGVWVFSLPDGQKVEVFDTSLPIRTHFDTGPVAGFVVADLTAAVAELRAAGVELLAEAGPSWQHFRGPDGNVYELVSKRQPNNTAAQPN